MRYVYCGVTKHQQKKFKQKNPQLLPYPLKFSQNAGEIVTCDVFSLIYHGMENLFFIFPFNLECTLTYLYNDSSVLTEALETEKE